jgi:hypothetical protein
MAQGVADGDHREIRLGKSAPATPGLNQRGPTRVVQSQSKCAREAVDENSLHASDARDRILAAMRWRAENPGKPWKEVAMRTIIIILGGLVLFAVFAGGARLFGREIANASSIAAWAFVAVWFVVAGGNMWIGVTQAGYSFKEELPIFLLIFLLPAAVAALVKWKFL